MHSVEMKQRLELLDKSVLVDALIQLAEFDKEAEALVKRLISTPAEAIALFKTKLAGIKRRRKFVYRSGSRALSHKLEDLIKFISVDAIPPVDALKCLVTFFESDHKIMNMCDDSNGDVSGVFKYEANQAFIKKANELAEQSPLLRMTKRLMKENDYGVRDSLFESTGDYLDEASLRKLFTHLEKQYEELKQTEPDAEQTYGKVFSAKIRLRTTAKQLNDPELFESLCLNDADQIHDYQMVDVAQVYFDSGKTETALEKLNSLKTIPINSVHDHKKLLLKIHASMGNDDKVKAIKISDFQNAPSQITYQAMLEHMKESQAERILEECLKDQETKQQLNTSHITFLLDLEQFQQASDYLLQRADQIDGDNDYTYPTIARQLITHNFPLSASLIYRALLLSLLARANTKSYSHGANYLRILTETSPSINDWANHPTHQAFYADLQEKHARKSSFWKRVSPLE